ncbi:hypothetical protein [Altererythrobacter sp. Z27]|uniref:hypothetical protein n=1 Tax=Altererythrobacter sp. Z27 TaxID=3461147 RepID=UPI0040449800
MDAAFTGNLTAQAAKLRRNYWRLLRILWFPFVTNLWPALLYLSQKAFVPVALVLNGWGDAAYRRDLFLTLSITSIGLFVYLTQPANSFQDFHALGFLLFVWAMPVINHAVRGESELLLRGLTYLTIFNALLGFYFFVNDVDLQEFRGLNRIESNDGYTERLFFESASLAAVFLLSTFRRATIRVVALVLVISFVVFIAKSVVVILLLGMNLIWPIFVRSSIGAKIGAAVVGAAGLFMIYLYLPVLRPDIFLSVLAKQTQLEVILSLQQADYQAWGWGAFVPQLATSIEQPYQIEMQLPMLMLQLGPLALAAIMALTLALFLSAAESKLLAFMRAGVYFLIGFNNPWLLVPSWFLTCQLLFRTDVRDTRTVSAIP